MAILKEWSCKAHGSFEAIVEQDETPQCPKGCSKRFVVREIRTAPAARGVVSGTLDQLQRGLAHDFGLSDLKAGRDDGKSVMQNLKRDGSSMAPHWVDVPGHLSTGWSRRKEKPAAVDVSSTFGIRPDNALSAVKLPTHIPTRFDARWDGK
jgi:hypothetical protein